VSGVIWAIDLGGVRVSPEVRHMHCYLKVPHDHGSVSFHLIGTDRSSRVENQKAELD